MMFYIKSKSAILGVVLTILKFGGLWCPSEFKGSFRKLYYVYSFMLFLFILGSYMICQSVSLCQIWGNLPLMTNVACVLLTDTVQVIKMANLLFKRNRIQRLIDDVEMVLTMPYGPEERNIITTIEHALQRLTFFFVMLTYFTIGGWAGSAEKGQLPVLAWYPYDTTRYPAYALTYAHQIGSIYMSATLNMSKDMLAVTLISLTGCRLQLVNYELRNFLNDLEPDPETGLLTAAQEATAIDRLRVCVRSHQMALRAAKEIEACFSLPIFAQFSVSLCIICVTAFQLATIDNPMLFVAFLFYLFNMIYQVYIYCYQGNEIVEQSTSLVDAAYASPWHRTSTAVRRRLLFLMMRSRKPVIIKAGGITTVTLQTFMAIVKTSYSLFTLLQDVEDNQAN
uniref:Odorant receptor n=1 Tax=Conopomorpha sinensis TaxID=940481 RepID=A0A3Q8HNT4_9NEOP|nr:putative odorant receptor 53 [Conopomorpha sinensis]